MRTMKLQVPDDVHDRILKAAAVEGAAGVYEWAVKKLDEDAKSALVVAESAKKSKASASSKKKSEKKS